MSLVKPVSFQQFSDIVIGQSTRLGGIPSKYGDFNLGESVGDSLDIVTQNREIFCRSLGFEIQDLAKSKQVHGSEVIIVENGGQYNGYDALITNKKGILLAVTVADCAPILLWDSKNEVIAAIHAGWKGTCEKIVTKTLQLMMNTFGTDASYVFAYIGTCISKNKYEVDYDVARHFKEKYRPMNTETGKYHLDIKLHNYDQLIALGVPLSQIEVSNYCTLDNKDKFYSHRGDKGKSGRMLAAIGMKKL